MGSRLSHLPLNKQSKIKLCHRLCGAPGEQEQKMKVKTPQSTFPPCPEVVYMEGLDLEISL